ncbi:phosphohydrolase [Rhizobium sp. 18065]|uniref:phosphohydrolase n=1 Tax=Rhizobium sp. 18065 TaxID=2681411 RepID=UPI00135AFCF1|nr:phosphohydrolase [Rhizobium sp. 18065]
MIPDYRPDICIYHGDCLDGFGAAWAIHLKWDRCDFRPGWYGKPLPLDGIDGKHVLFVDFSASEVELLGVAHRAASVVVLDHHKTAEAALQRFIMPGFSIDQCNWALSERSEQGLAPLVAFFDQNQSGATMAWELASQGGDYHLPELLMYIADRDLWKFHFGDTTRAVCAAIQSYPMDFAVWDEWRHWRSGGHQLVAQGEAILRANRMTVEKLLADVRWQMIDGHNVPTVNAPYQFASDAGHALLARYPEDPFAATYFIRADGRIQWSLRSEDGRQDVSEIATANGGGGHRNAAGFTSTYMLYGIDHGSEF